MIRPLVLLCALPLSALGETTIDSVSRYAFSPNLGWISFRGDQDNGVVVEEHVLSGFAWGSTTGWINFGDGSPSDKVHYSNSTGEDFGVNLTVDGTLSGRAWGASIGWISFDWASADSADRPRIDLSTGEFQGFAYGANVGWINLGAGHLTTKSLKMVDEDKDGISDRWEHQQFGDTTTASASSDQDQDGVSDRLEYEAATDPRDKRSYLRLLRVESESKNVRLQFSSHPGRRYRVLVGADLKSFQDSGLGTITPDSGTTTTRTIPRTAETRFYRVVAVRPLR